MYSVVQNKGQWNFSKNSFNVSATIFFYFSLFGDFQSDLCGHGNPLEDATPIFMSDSGSSILGLSNEVHIMSVVQEVSEKIAKTYD